MKRYEGTTFVSNVPIGGCEVVGNFAVVYILEEGEDLNKQIMSELGLKERAPMTCFLKNIKKNNFEISFWNLDGSQAFMCVHSALVAARVLNELYGLTKINMFFDADIYEKKIEDRRLALTAGKNNFTSMETTTKNIEIIGRANFNEKIFKIIGLMGLELGDVEDALWCSELRDLAVVVKDAAKMRKMKPKFTELAPILDDMRIRNLCSTAKSDQKNFDFEERVFCPHDNLDEDLACGSSVIAIAKYWEKRLGKRRFNVLFPFHLDYEKDRRVGGVERIVIKKDGRAVSVGGFCK
ncbi:MAG: PhzF family phenazine biosynthesis protein [Rickettsiales bacterium]|jgi:predicted PhzF superfamily epimerase YddE/YHI9|nr:PhzF family phenazine biosynthesis protein [Rickettsiales bacterium]